MRRGILILWGLCATGLALAGCSDPEPSDRAADSAQATVTVTAPAPDPRSNDGPPATEKQSAPDPAPKEVPKSAPEIKPDAEEEGTEPGSPPGMVEATNASPPEVTLAVIDKKSAYVRRTTVTRYAGLLDRLERACDEPRIELAESALTASRSMQGTETRLSILDVLRQVVASGPSGACADAFARVSS